MTFIADRGGMVINHSEIMETAGATSYSRIVNLQLLFREDSL